MHNIGRAMDAARLDQVCNLLWRLNKLHLRYDTNEAAAKAGNVQGWIKRWALGCVNSPPRSEASMTRGHATQGTYFHHSCTAICQETETRREKGKKYQI